MIRSYFKVAWRNLQKHKVFSFINIFGLAVGMAAFWLITLYITDEWSYDRYNIKAGRIFRVVQHGEWKGGKFDIAVTPPPFGAALKADFPQMENFARIDAEGGAKLAVGNKQLSEGSIVLADNGIFDIFSYRFLYGDANTALLKPNSIVLNNTLATNLFGSAGNAFNKTLLADGTPTVVTAVIEDLPVNSHITFKALRTMPERTGFAAGWGNADIYTYVLLKNHDDHKILEAGAESFFARYLQKDMGAMKFIMELQPLTDIHLKSSLSYEMGANGDITYVYVFGVTALLILIIAIINYVNLTTARSSIRVKEIGIRKVIGSDREQLMIMFFAECILLTFIAAVMAAAIVQFALPYFNRLSGKHLLLLQFGRAETLSIFTGLSLLAGIISGIYPALFLSGFKTIPAMKGHLGNQVSTVLFRKSLVVFQFVITIVMIAGSFVIYQQLNYFRTKDLGFNKTQTLTFHVSQPVRGKMEAIKQQLLQNPGIESVGVAGNPIGNNNIGGGDFNLGPDGKADAGSKIVQNLIIDEDFIPTLQISMAAGRNFNKQVTTDAKASVIVNQTLINEMGWKDPIGRKVRTGVDEQGRIIEQTIIGVVKDFNTYSLHHKIAPMLFELPAKDNDRDNLYIRISRNNVQASLAHISKVYAGFDNEDKAEIHFLDQNFAARYQTEQKQGTILLIFTILAISIACLGLFGLVTFTAEQRVKEIGIRKVMGASVASIVNLLSVDLMRLVLIAVLIAAPVAWFAMNRWLQDFAYKISISWWILVLAGGGAALIALATVSAQSIKAALNNPVKSLRSE